MILPAPFGPPDCPWRKASSDSAVPETAVYKDGKLDGDDIYIGRVYDGNCLLIGTAIPKKGICIYLHKNSEVKSSPDYEVIFLFWLLLFYCMYLILLFS